MAWPRTSLLYVLVVVLASAAVGAVTWFATKPPPATPSSGGPAVSHLDLDEPPPPPPSAPAMPPGVDIRFVDATAQAGIHFQHCNDATDREYIMETMGSGVGWLDYDGDGLMDLFLVQGAPTDSAHATATCKLYRNLGHGQFRDVTDKIGLAHVGQGMGVAVGDIDNDGYPDLFLTCYGKPNVLYHNEPDGHGGRRFVDITARAGLADHPDWHGRPNYSTSAAFLDYDNDGRLDLFVCSYVKIDLAHYPECQSRRSGHTYSCPPALFQSTRCILYRNRGDNTFVDVSKQAGIDHPNAKALGVIALDLDGDGRVDLFVANDGLPNFLFRNQGNGHFESVGVLSGCAVNLAGGRQAYMGVDADDLHGDGRPDLFVTAFSQETNTLFCNEGRGQFLDVTHGSGLGPPSWPMLGFGTCFLDADLDGRLDIAVVNGHVSRHIRAEGDPRITYRQPAQFFYNLGGGRFRDLSSEVGGYFQERHVGRGLACCDYDNDGRMDLAVNNNGEPAVLLHNETSTSNHWIRLELQGTKSNRDAVGARVTVQVGNQRLVRHRKGGGSYLSASDPRLLIGLGSAARVDSMEVRWPSGLVQHLGPLAADHGYRIVEGKAGAEPRP